MKNDFCIHSPNAEISVGARALAKHFHRDSTESWWGVSTGSESLILISIDSNFFVLFYHEFQMSESVHRVKYHRRNMYV